MAIRDANGRAAVALAEGPEELWRVPGSGAAELPDWRSLYERERERAEAAEARAEELRWAEVRARCEAGSWKWRWEASRRKLKGVVAETRAARRAGRDALALQHEVGRLHGLLREAGVDAAKASPGLGRVPAGAGRERFLTGHSGEEGRWAFFPSSTVVDLPSWALPAPIPCGNPSLCSDGTS